MRVKLFIVFILILLLNGSVVYAYNFHPIADLVVRAYVIKDKVVVFDASGSIDYDQGIVKYEWDFDDDGTYDYFESSDSYSTDSVCPDGKFDGITTYILTSTGTKNIKVRVTDDYFGVTDTYTVTINVSDDTDGDCLPDDWETDDVNGIGLSSIGDEDWEDDSDSDGCNNLCEYLHETDPNDNGDTPSDAGYFLVPDDANTIQKALDSSIDDDEFVVFEGTYYENLQFSDSAIILRSYDPNDPFIVDATIIDGNSLGSVLTFTTGDGNSIVNGFTIQNGYVEDADGGGIYCEDVDPVIRNCVIRSNEAEYSSDGGYGGGIQCDGSNMILESCIIENNTASTGGGGMSIVNDSDPNIINCVFSNNTSDSIGGAVYTDDDLTPDIVGCLFVDNFAEGDGGAVYLDGVINGDPDDPMVNIINCTFYDNDSNSSGGGLCTKRNFYLANSIFWGNSAADGGDEIHNYTDYWGLFYGYINNCNIAGCNGSSENWDTDLGIDWDGNRDEDPYFVNSGYPAGTDSRFFTIDDGLQLRVDSNCVGDANNSDIDNYDISFDITGIVSRKVDADRDSTTTVDMGAYEVPLIYYVDDDVESGDGESWATAYDDLQNALDDVSSGDQIWVADGIYYPGTSSYDSFEMVEGVAIIGSLDGSENTWLDCKLYLNSSVLSGEIGTSSSSDNSIHVVKGCDNAILDGFVITGGYADGNYEYSAGGGMYNYHASPTVKNCVFADNYASSFGGGMYYFESSPVIVNCVFTRNTAYDGGGGISGHKITGMSLGGQYPPKESSICGGARIANCTFAENVASPGNDIVFGHNGTVTNSIIASDFAAAIYVSDTSFSYCNIADSNGSGPNWWEWSGIDLGGNIDEDPCFVDVNNPAGADGIYGSWDDGLKLDVNSPCIDAADGNSAPLYDLLCLGRLDINDVNNTGTGIPVYTDMGSFESYKGLDSDGDGIDDDYEDMFDLDKNSDDSKLDSDGDGLSNAFEFLIGTYADNADTDGDGMGDGWEYEFNDSMNPVVWNDPSADTDGDGRTDLIESQDYSDPNHATEVTRLAYTYDAAGRVIKEIAEDKIYNTVSVSENDYDELGRQWRTRSWASTTASSDSSDILSLTSYDEQGNVKKSVQKIGTDADAVESSDIVTETFYDYLGRVTDVNDPNNDTTSYIYNSYGQLYQVIDAKDNATTRVYDTIGRVIETEDAAGNYTQVSYDSLGRTVKTIACDSYGIPLSQSRSVYDTAGNLIRSAVMAEADSTSAINTSEDMVTDYYYADVNGMLVNTTKYYNEGAQAITYYTYDGIGRRSCVTDPAGNKVYFVYDAGGHLINLKQLSYAKIDMKLRVTNLANHFLKSAH